MLAVLAWQRHWEWLPQVRRSRRVRLVFLTTAALLSINWLTYIWAVTNGHIVDASLGYFINPLVSVLLGVLILRERLRPSQWVAVGLALGGVLFLTLGYGSVPWIALVLAFTFGLYGLLRKTASLDALAGLTLEMAILFLPALLYLIHMEATGRAFFGHVGDGNGITISILLAFSGIVTALPLILFTYAARKIPLATVGILQYIAPTLQFLLGVLVYGETLTGTKLAGFAAVWSALLLYSLENFLVAGRGGA
jgi:chloramphenicol-sensitive protein RarD